tara:strand:- start:138 stop:668 length:531 start_codon:yes stop_codon:yes gene_type:complete
MSKHIILDSQHPHDKVNIQNMLKNNSIFIKFYSDTCGYCQEMKSEWDNAIHKIHNKRPKNLLIVEVEANNMNNFEDEDMIKPKIMGYPTIMYLNKKNNKVQVIPYNGSRTSDEFVNFAFKNLKNSVNIVKNKKAKNTKKNKKAKNTKKNKKAKKAKKDKKSKKGKTLKKSKKNNKK